MQISLAIHLPIQQSWPKKSDLWVKLFNIAAVPVRWRKDLFLWFTFSTNHIKWEKKRINSGVTSILREDLWSTKHIPEERHGKIH